MDNPTSSVFCSHGAGFVVSWDKVKDYMHLEALDLPVGQAEALAWEKEGEGLGISAGRSLQQAQKPQEEAWIGEDEVEAILSRTAGANKREQERGWRYHKKKVNPSAGAAATRTYQAQEPKESYLSAGGWLQCDICLGRAAQAGGR